MGSSITRLRRLTSWWLASVALVVLVCLPAKPLAAAVIDFWCPWPHAEQAVRSLAAQYSKQSGTTVRVRVLTPSAYNPWNVKQGPDLVGLIRPTKRGIEQLAKAGRVYDLKSHMSRGWYADFWPGMLETFNIRKEGKTGVYGVPLTGQVHTFVYNKTLFRKARINIPPRTWGELMGTASRLRKAGIVPYAGGFGSDRPPLACCYEWSYLGLHGLAQTYFGRFSYTSREWTRNLTLYAEMKESGFLNFTSATMSGVDAIKALLDGRVAMVFTDSSFESIRKTCRPDFRAWDLFGAPVDDRAQFLPRLPGGVVEGLVINKRSAKKAEAIAFAKWLTEHEQQIAFANAASAIPATPDACSDRRLLFHLRLFASTGMRDQSVDIRNYENPHVLSVFYSGVRSIIKGSASPSEVARRTQAARKRK